ncbi:MAG TPA: autotransporter outer membrane beta-barrel domain-containing protein, partial [Bauldia sp.]|nr:autotransporter outer membrane beta-barrel domain-containing protein [Bauldia sp.]
MAATAVIFAGAAGLLLSAESAQADCSATSPASGATVDCSGSSSTGVIAAGSTDVTVNVLPGGSINPASGPSVWLGAGAEINLQAGSTTGNDASGDTYAVLMGDASTVVVNGTIQSTAGITGPTQGAGSTGFSNADVTIGQTGKIIVSSQFSLYEGLDGRGGGNTYQIDGELTGTSTFADNLISVGNGDKVTVGATGKLTVHSESGSLISNSSATGVRVTTAAESVLQIDGAGTGIDVGGNANVTVGGAIVSDGHVADVNDGSSPAIQVGTGSTVWLKDGGTITTGNPDGLGNVGSGAIAIETYVLSGASNSTVTVDGIIDTYGALSHGIFGGTGDTITVGATGKITSREFSQGIFVRAKTTTTDHHVGIDVAGDVEQLGTGMAIRIQADQGPDLDADVTVEEGGSLYAAAGNAYGQLDGAGSYGAVIDNLVVKGTIARGNSGTAIDLNDGADTITLFPTYSITGGIDGGNATSGTQIDTFVLDGATGTNGTFDFDSISVTNFEAGDKKGLGHWTLTGNAGTGINGTFAVDAGLLSVNGTLTSADFAVGAGAVLGGSGTLKSVTVNSGGKVAPGNSIGTLTVSSATYAAGSIFEVEVDPSSADKLIVNGAASIDPTAQVSVLAAPGTYTDGTSYLVLDASGGSISGAFADAVVDNSAFLSFTLDQTTHANQVWLTVANVAALPDVAETPNQIAAAGGIQGQGPGSDLYDAIALLDADSARNAFDLSSGEVHATLLGALAADARLPREAVLARFDADWLDGAGGGGADGPAVAPQWGAWAQGFGSSGHADGDGNAAGNSRSLGGFLAGLDASQAGAWRIGAAAGYSGSSISIADRASSATVAAYHATAYGGLESGPWALRLGGAVA